MKKTVTILLAAALTMASVPAFAADAVTATPNSSSVLVNGTDTKFEAYNIGGYNYFKLRDISYSLNGTTNSFSVAWDAENNAMSLTTKAEYTAVGGEMAVSENTDKKSAVASDSKVLVDEKEVTLEAYNIDGYNYFKLRDLGDALGFTVDWNAETSTISITTAAETTEEGTTTETPAEGTEEGTTTETPAEGTEEGTTTETPAEGTEEGTTTETPATESTK
ncbi:hypothetical protein B5E58_01070 [Tyzzerella sp. An114]|uniref:stalk domain-containing protein n=1 Tax=Tyzzerella sp. An114 TaxID=1965545 RepID=UPI000B4488D8|nr:stalk domain-containing protein [Tyzzerella sp. An114]OUQ60490.1 hypothetical protein B5E58_01070 [Tyzzerella sp. An114]